MECRHGARFGCSICGVPFSTYVAPQWEPIVGETESYEEPARGSVYDRFATVCPFCGGDTLDGHCGDCSGHVKQVGEFTRDEQEYDATRIKWWVQ